MKTYQCHKKVQAGKVVRAWDSHPFYWARLEDGQDKIISYRTLEMIKEDEAKGHDIGYLVVYEDGYTSYSPTEPFESGYTLVE